MMPSAEEDLQNGLRISGFPAVLDPVEKGPQGSVPFGDVPEEHLVDGVVREDRDHGRTGSCLSGG